MKTLLISLLAALSLIASSCAKKTGSEEEQGATVKATVAVKTVVLRRGDMAAVVECTGRIDALRNRNYSRLLPAK